MRLVLIWLVGLLCCCTALHAQARLVTLELEAGGVVEGRVVEIDSKKIVVDVNGEERTYANEQIRFCRFQEVEGPAPKVPAGQGEQGPTAGGAAAPGPETVAPAGAEREPMPARRPYQSIWDRRLDALDTAYPWLFPTEPLQWISLGIMLFALLSLAIHFAARLAASDSLNFGRAMGVAMWLLLTGIGQMAVLPLTREAVAIALAGNAIVLMVLFAIVYGLSFGASFLGLLVFGLQGGLGFALLQLVDATLRSIGKTTF